jgi:hypothetical protein
LTRSQRRAPPTEVKSTQVRATDELAPLLVLWVKETSVAAEDGVEARADLFRRERGSYREPIAEYGPKPS